MKKLFARLKKITSVILITSFCVQMLPQINNTNIVLASDNKPSNTVINEPFETPIIPDNTYIVTSDQNDGEGSLREAVRKADILPNYVRIAIDSRKVKSITLNEPLIAKKQVEILGNGVSIKNAGSGLVIKADNNLTIRDLHISGSGKDDSGGVFAQGVLHVVSGSFTNNRGTVIQATDNIMLENVSVAMNIAKDKGVIDIQSIVNPSIKMNNCYIYGNITSSKNKGIISGVKVTDVNSTIESNTTEGNGGAVEAAEVSLTNTTIRANIAAKNGGGVYATNNLVISGGLIENNIAGENGGGAFSQNSISITSGKIFRNSAKSGGGVNSQGKTIIIYSDFYGNSAIESGGGLSVSKNKAEVKKSLFSGNVAGVDGGGIKVYSESDFSVYESTFAQNISVRNGGAINSESTATSIQNSTISGNFAGFAVPDDEIMVQAGAKKGSTLNHSFGKGAGIYVVGGGADRTIIVGNYAYQDGGKSGNYSAQYDVSVGGTMVIANSSSLVSDLALNGFIVKESIVNKDASTCLETTIMPDPFTPKFYDIAELTRVGSSGELKSTDKIIHIGVLKDNGGPTKTIAIKADIYDNPSFATIKAVIPTDQRGVPYKYFGKGYVPGAFSYTVPLLVTIPGEPEDLRSLGDGQRSLRSVLASTKEYRDIKLGLDYTVYYPDDSFDWESFIIISEAIMVTIVLIVATAGIGVTLTPSFVSAITLPTYVYTAATAATAITSTIGGVIGLTTGLAGSIHGVNHTYELKEVSYNEIAADTEKRKTSMIGNLLTIRPEDVTLDLGEKQGNVKMFRTATDIAINDTIRTDGSYKISGNPPYLGNRSLVFSRSAYQIEKNADKKTLQMKNGNGFQTDGNVTLEFDNLIFDSFRGTTENQASVIDAVNGTVIARNCIFTDNTVLIGGVNGSVIRAKNIILIDCQFINNGGAKYGGAVYATNNLTMVNTSFINNRSTDFGGAFYCKGDLVAENIIIENNKSAYGAAGVVHGNADIRNGAINLNVSTDASSTSALHVAKDLKMIGVTLADNTSVGVVAEGKAFIAACTISANSHGGLSAGEAYITASIITGNEGKNLNTKALLVNGTNFIDVPDLELPSLMDTRIRNGVAIGYLKNNGGTGRSIAINPFGLAHNALDNTMARMLNVPGTDSRGMSRSLGGGAYDIGAVELQHMYAGTSLNNAVDASNRSKYGANVVYFGSTNDSMDIMITGINVIPEVTVSGTNNLEKSVALIPINFEQGIQYKLIKTDSKRFLSSVNPEVNVYVAGLSFSNGVATNGSNGGAISTEGRVETYNCAFENNQADGAGGAIYAGSLGLANTTFYNNKATKGMGGAVWQTQNGFHGLLNKISNCTFVENSASSFGSAYYGHSLTSIKSSTFTGNVNETTKAPNASGLIVFNFDQQIIDLAAKNKTQLYDFAGVLAAGNYDAGNNEQYVYLAGKGQYNVDSFSIYPKGLLWPSAEPIKTIFKNVKTNQQRSFGNYIDYNGFKIVLLNDDLAAKNPAIKAIPQANRDENKLPLVDQIGVTRPKSSSIGALEPITMLNVIKYVAVKGVGNYQKETKPLLWYAFDVSAIDKINLYTETLYPTKLRWYSDVFNGDKWVLTQLKTADSSMQISAENAPLHEGENTFLLVLGDGQPGGMSNTKYVYVYRHPNMIPEITYDQINNTKVQLHIKLQTTKELEKFVKDRSYTLKITENADKVELDSKNVLTAIDTSSDFSVTVVVTSKQGKRETSINIPFTFTSVVEKDKGGYTGEASFSVIESVGISPASDSVPLGSNKNFTATVSGIGIVNSDVIWSLEGNNKENTTISSSGILYVAPDETATTLTITATSVQDSSKFAIAIVSVTAKTISVTINPASSTISKGSSQNFTATVSNFVSNSGVIWSLEGAPTGSTLTTNSDGTATLLISTAEITSNFTVVATSIEDNTKSARASVVVD